MVGYHLSTPQDPASSVELPRNYPHPRFYLVRPDNTHVPLIAIDELGPGVRIVGTPASVTAKHVEDWNMARVGDMVYRSKELYRVEFVDREETPAESTPQKQVGSEEHMIASTDVRSVTSSAEAPFAQTTWPSAIEASMSTNNASEKYPRFVEGHHEDESEAMKYAQSTKDHPSKTKDAMTPGFYGKKKYCTYWIRTGNCDYVQEGCKYLHVIPDEETRLQIGIRDMPRWTREDLPPPGKPQLQTKEFNGSWRQRNEDDSGKASASFALHHNSPSDGKLSKRAQPLNPQAKEWTGSSKPVAVGSSQHFRYQLPQEPNPVDSRNDASSATDSYQRQMQSAQSPAASILPGTKNANAHSGVGSPMKSPYSAQGKQAAVLQPAPAISYQNYSPAPSSPQSFTPERARYSFAQQSPVHDVPGRYPWNDSGNVPQRSHLSNATDSRSATPATYGMDGLRDFGSRFSGPTSPAPASLRLSSPFDLSPSPVPATSPQQYNAGNEAVRQYVTDTLTGKSGNPTESHFMHPVRFARPGQARFAPTPVQGFGPVQRPNTGSGQEASGAKPKGQQQLIDI